MERKDLNGITVNCPDDPDAGELTMTQMEKITAGSSAPGSQIKENGLDCFVCPGTDCGWTLQHIRGNLYRCTNPLCPLFGQDQYPG